MYSETIVCACARMCPQTFALCLCCSDGRSDVCLCVLARPTYISPLPSLFYCHPTSPAISLLHLHTHTPSNPHLNHTNDAPALQPTQLITRSSCTTQTHTLTHTQTTLSRDTISSTNIQTHTLIQGQTQTNDEIL